MKHWCGGPTNPSRFPSGPKFTKISLGGWILKKMGGSSWETCYVNETPFEVNQLHRWNNEFHLSFFEPAWLNETLNAVRAWLHLCWKEIQSPKINKTTISWMPYLKTNRSWSFVEASCMSIFVSGSVPFVPVGSVENQNLVPCFRENGPISSWLGIHFLQFLCNYGHFGRRERAPE